MFRPTRHRRVGRSGIGPTCRANRLLDPGIAMDEFRRLLPNQSGSPLVSSERDDRVRRRCD
jgi:hypothetical protein